MVDERDLVVVVALDATRLEVVDGATLLLEQVEGLACARCLGKPVARLLDVIVLRHGAMLRCVELALHPLDVDLADGQLGGGGDDGSGTPPDADSAQTITFVLPSGLVYGVRPVALHGTASSGLAVGYRSATPTVCAVTNARLTVLGAGRCTVTASQPGGDGYAAAPDVTRTVEIARAKLTITASDAVLRKGKATPAIRPSYRGLVHGDTAPRTRPTCSANLKRMTTACHGAADRNYTIRYVTGLVRKTQVISVKNPGRLTDAMSSVRLRVAASSHRHVTLSTRPGGVCSLTGRTLRILGAGRCVITATVGGNRHYAPAHRTITLRIVAIARPRFVVRAE